MLFANMGTGIFLNPLGSGESTGTDNSKQKLAPPDKAELEQWRDTSFREEIYFGAEKRFVPQMGVDTSSPVTASAPTALPEIPIGSLPKIEEKKTV